MLKIDSRTIIVDDLILARATGPTMPDWMRELTPPATARLLQAVSSNDSETIASLIPGCPNPEEVRAGFLSPDNAHLSQLRRIGMQQELSAEPIGNRQFPELKRQVFLAYQELIAPEVASIIRDHFPPQDRSSEPSSNEAEPARYDQVTVLNLTSLGDDAGFSQALSEFSTTVLPRKDGAARSASLVYRSDAHQAGNLVPITVESLISELAARDRSSLNALRREFSHGLQVALFDASLVSKLNGEQIKELFGGLKSLLDPGGIFIVLPPPFHRGFSDNSDTLPEDTGSRLTSADAIMRSLAGIGCPPVQRNLGLPIRFEKEKEVAQKEFVRAVYDPALMPGVDSSSRNSLLLQAAKARTVDYFAPIIVAAPELSFARGDHYLGRIFGENAPKARIALARVLSAIEEEQEAAQGGAAASSTEEKFVVLPHPNPDFMNFVSDQGAMGRLFGSLYLACSDRERAQDALQHALMKTHGVLSNGVVVNDFHGFAHRVGINFLRDIARKKSSSMLLSSNLDSERLRTPLDSNASISPVPRVESPLFDQFLDHEAAENSSRTKNIVGSNILLRVLFNLSAVDAAKVLSIMEGDEVTGAGSDMRTTRERRRFKDFLDSRVKQPVDRGDFTPGDIFGEESISSDGWR